MAVATINGKPSLFVSPDTPTEIYPVYSDRVSTFTEIAEQMATEGETEMTDEDMLNDPEFQAEYNEYLERLDEEWRNDPEAQRKFEEWCDEQERIANEEAMLNASCASHDADAHELASLGCAAGHYIAGHDDVWQQGGDV